MCFSAHNALSGFFAFESCIPMGSFCRAQLSHTLSYWYHFDPTTDTINFSCLVVCAIFCLFYRLRGFVIRGLRIRRRHVWRVTYRTPSVEQSTNRINFAYPVVPWSKAWSIRVVLCYLLQTIVRITYPTANALRYIIGAGSFKTDRSRCRWIIPTINISVSVL